MKSEKDSGEDVMVLDLKVEVKCSLTNDDTLNSLARSPLLSKLSVLV